MSETEVSSKEPVFIKEEPVDDAFESDDHNEELAYEEGQENSSKTSLGASSEVIKCEPELPIECKESAEDEDNLFEFEKTLPCCFLCNGVSEKSWPPAVARRRKKIARSVCYLLEMEVEAFIEPFYDHPYCIECQERLQKIDNVMSNLEKLKKKIARLKSQFEDDMKHFWIGSPTNKVPAAAKEYHKIRKHILKGE